ncbi:hypothetical protein SH501x_005278 [Pirellulaceae bacterium SH501]
MSIQRIHIPIASVVKAIKRKELFVLGVAGLGSASSPLALFWSDVVTELSKSLESELSTAVNHVRFDEPYKVEQGSSRGSRFHSIGTVLQWRKHRLTVVDFDRSSEKALYQFGPQCDGVVAVVGTSDRETQRSVRELVNAGIQVLGYWSITCQSLPLNAA